MDTEVQTPVVPIPETLFREGKTLLLALPFYKTASPLTMFSLLALMDRSKMGVSLGFGDAFIIHSRNKLATQLVNSSLEWMFFVDDDMILPFGDAKWFNANTDLRFTEEFAGVNVINRLMSHKKTLIGVTYFGRWRKGPPVFAEGKALEASLRRDGPRNEIRPTKWIGTGGLLIHRSVLLDIEKRFPHLSRDENKGVGQWFSPSEHDLKNAVSEVKEVLEGSISDAAKVLRVLELLRAAEARARAHSGLGTGEDVSFCVRAAQAGHQPFIDLGCWAGHVGSCVYPIR